MKDPAPRHPWTIQPRAVAALPAYAVPARRSMKMGTIVSPWRYDVLADYALQPAILRRPAIVRCASRAAIFPISRSGPVIDR